jgi:glycosyltransferase involved in cell wall biosynthesis
MKISAVIITLNEEHNIKDCLKTVKWADEIIIIDSESKDKTKEIASEFTDKIYSTETNDFASKRKLGIQKASNDWIFFLDADERVTPELKDEILNLQENNQENNIEGYLINRKNFYLGKWVKHSGIYPDYHLRLFKKQNSIITNRPVHEGVEVKGPLQKLENHILHYSVNSLEGLVEKCDLYSSLQAKEFLQNGKKVSKFSVFPKAFAMFLIVFFSRKGYKDKASGFFVGISYSLTNFLTSLKLLKLQKKI